MTEQFKLPLRIITFLVPGLSVELFENISQYLEASLGTETMLFYESRFNGPQSDRIDPFKTNVADLGNTFQSTLLFDRYMLIILWSVTVCSIYYRSRVSKAF